MIAASVSSRILSAPDETKERTNMDATSQPKEISSGPSRRQTVQWVMAAVAASALPNRTSHAEPRVRPGSATNATPPKTTPSGYGADPVLVKEYHPGDFWPLTFTPGQQGTATALADLIIPKDNLGPAASEVGVVAMINEWISAPYPQQKGDRLIILDGLAWIDAEAKTRYQKSFAELTSDQHRAICEEISFTGNVKPALSHAAIFFDRFRDLCASAYYATPEGWTAIGYVGNVALEQFDGPPPEVLEKLGVTQTVL